MTGPWMSTTEVARFCHVEARTVCHWCDEGWIDHHRWKTGNRKIHVQALWKFMVEYDLLIIVPLLTRHVFFGIPLESLK